MKVLNVCISMVWLGITILVQIVNASRSRNNAIVNQTKIYVLINSFSPIIQNDFSNLGCFALIRIVPKNETTNDLPSRPPLVR